MKLNWTKLPVKACKIEDTEYYQVRSVWLNELEAIKLQKFINVNLSILRRLAQ